LTSSGREKLVGCMYQIISISPWHNYPYALLTRSDYFNATLVKFINKLDDSFFKVRFDRATGNEKIFMFAMSDLGKGPYETAAIANKLNKTTNQISLDRANLINKGFIYTTQHGYLDFTVPQFDKYLNRIKRN